MPSAVPGVRCRQGAVDPTSASRATGIGACGRPSDQADGPPDVVAGPVGPTSLRHVPISSSGAHRPYRMTGTPDSADLLISGGAIIDGTGAPGHPGSVVVDGERLRLLTPMDPEPTHVARRIDATGMVVAPGFIDLHSHGGLVILAEPRHEPKVRQGVTTEIVGVDGNGFAPFATRRDLEDFVELDSGPRRPAGHRPRLGFGRELPRTLRRDGERQRRDAGRELGPADRCPGLGRHAGRRPRDRPDARRCSARRCRTAPSA